MDESTIKNLNLTELKNLKEQIDNEIKNREAQESNQIVCEFETDEYFDRRKHGHAYIAVITKDESGKIQREFINNVNRVYDTKGKYYQASWKVALPIGTKIEARLTDGSWKNDYRSYFIVESDGLRKSEKNEVMK